MNINKKIFLLIFAASLQGCALGGGRAQILREELIKDAGIDLNSSAEDVRKLGTQFIEFKSKAALQQLDQHFANLIKLGYDTDNLTPDKVAQISEQYFIERKKIEDFVKTDAENLLVLVNKVESGKRALDALAEMDDYKERQSVELSQEILKQGPALIIQALGENADPKIVEEVSKIWAMSETETEIPEGVN
jgi:hypothetical protein